jgi:hypothetical protein
MPVEVEKAFGPRAFGEIAELYHLTSILNDYLLLGTDHGSRLIHVSETSLRESRELPYSSFNLLTRIYFKT